MPEEATTVRSRIQQWIDDHPERGYALSSEADAVIQEMINRKNDCNYTKYYCPCMVVLNENDPITVEYNDSIECMPCLQIRDESLAADGIEKDGTCHCGMLVKKDTNQDDPSSQSNEPG